MPSIGGTMRPLPFPLGEAVSLEAETPTRTGNIQMPPFPADSDEEITVAFRLTLNKFVALATAIDVGSDPAYGENAVLIWYIWATSMVNLCEEIARCIEETEAVREALAQWFSDAVDNNTLVQQALERAFNPSNPGAAIPQGYAQQNQYGAALGCDMDDGWGHIRDGLIERSFQRLVDVLEQIEAVTDNQEMLAQFLNAMPVIGAFFDVIPVTDWVLWFDNVRAWMKDTFEAADTTELRDAVACDLFCIWRINCSLSLEQIREYYWQKTIELVPEWESAFDSMSELAVALGTLSTVDFGAGVVYALVGSQYGFLTFINDWFGITVAATGNDLALGEPSDDWSVLCDCPEEWEYAFPGDLPFSEFTALTFDGATTTIDSDSIDGANATNGLAVFLNFEIELTGNVNHVEFDVEFNPSNASQQFIFLDEGGMLQQWNLDGTSPRTLEWDGMRSGTHTFSVLAGVFGNTGTGEFLRVVGMRWSGFGEDPFA